MGKNKLKDLFSSLKQINDDMFLKNEKITLIDRKQLFIQNYSEIVEITDENIRLKRINIIGRDLKIASISKFFIEITGNIIDIRLGDNKND